MKRLSLVFFAATIALPLLATACSNNAEPGKAADSPAVSAPADADKEWNMPNKNY